MASKKIGGLTPELLPDQNGLLIADFGYNEIRQVSIASILGLKSTGPILTTTVESIPQEGGDIPLILTSDANWALNAPSGVSISGSGNSSSGTAVMLELITANFPANTGNNNKTHTIKVTNGSGESSVTLQQDGITIIGNTLHKLNNLPTFHNNTHYTHYTYNKYSRH
jgi:hypothetical protein